MERELIWQPVALEEYYLIIEFLFQKWNIAVADQFEQTVKLRSESLRLHPEAGLVISDERSVRRIVIHKRTILYYQYDPSKEIIEIVSVFDTRQDPDTQNFRR